MPNKNMTKMDMRSATLAFSIVAMLVVSFGFNGSVNAAGSPVSLSTEETTKDIMVGESVIIPIKVDSSDTVYRKMDVYLIAYFEDGVTWSTQFRTTGGSVLSGSLVSLGKEGEQTVNLYVYCDSGCSAGDSTTVSIRGQTDPKFYPSGRIGDNCGSSDCLSDSTPASSSSNVTNVLQVQLNARTGGSHTVECDTVSDAGNDLMVQSATYQWGFEVENTGWEDDTYTFDLSVESADGYDTSGWTLDEGLSSVVLTGQKDTSSTAAHSAEDSMSISPGELSKPGVYSLTFKVSGTNSGNDETCEFNVRIQKPDLEITDADIEFSHSSAWINSRGDSQRVTIYATVRNNGGTVDTEGNQVKDVEVLFQVDGSQLGSVQKIPLLGFGEEVKLSVVWNPGRAHDSNEVGIPIGVRVDPNADIKEETDDNNVASTHFKVVKTKASNPSFYMSFLSIVGAVGAAVLLSAYYRNKDE